MIYVTAPLNRSPMMNLMELTMIAQLVGAHKLIYGLVREKLAFKSIHSLEPESGTPAHVANEGPRLPILSFGNSKDLFFKRSSLAGH